MLLPPEDGGNVPLNRNNIKLSGYSLSGTGPIRVALYMQIITLKILSTVI